MWLCVKAGIILGYHCFTEQEVDLISSAQLKYWKVLHQEIFPVISMGEAWACGMILFFGSVAHFRYFVHYVVKAYRLKHWRTQA